MVLKTLNFPGKLLDVSAPEADGDPNPIIFRRTVKIGDVFTIQEGWYDQIPNIKNAVAAGYLQIVEDDDPGGGGNSNINDIFALMGA